MNSCICVSLWAVLCSQCHFIVMEVTKPNTNWFGTFGQPLGPKCVSFCVVSVPRCCHCCYIMVRQLNLYCADLKWRIALGPRTKVLILILFKRVYRYAHAGPLRTRLTRMYEEFRIDHCSDKQLKEVYAAS